RVDAGDSVCVDAEFDGQLTDGGELVAGLQPSGGDGRAHAAFELRVDWCRIARVDGQDVRHLFICTSSIVQMSSGVDYHEGHEGHEEYICPSCSSCPSWLRLERVLHPKLHNPLIAAVGRDASELTGGEGRNARRG